MRRARRHGTAPVRPGGERQAAHPEPWAAAEGGVGGAARPLRQVERPRQVGRTNHGSLDSAARHRQPQDYASAAARRAVGRTRGTRGRRLRPRETAAACPRWPPPLTAAARGCARMRAIERQWWWHRTACVTGSHTGRRLPDQGATGARTRRARQCHAPLFFFFRGRDGVRAGAKATKEGPSPATRLRSTGPGVSSPAVRRRAREAGARWRRPEAGWS